MNSQLGLALYDAATNCTRDDAVATITLRGSGVQFEGRLDRPEGEVVHMRLPDGGWATIDREEVAAVSTRRKGAREISI